MAETEGPYCECGHCDATGRNGGDEVVLPAEAWSVAGFGDPNRLAVHPDHIEFLEGLPVERFDGWAAVG